MLDGGVELRQWTEIEIPTSIYNPGANVGSVGRLGNSLIISGSPNNLFARLDVGSGKWSEIASPLDKDETVGGYCFTRGNVMIAIAPAFVTGVPWPDTMKISALGGSAKWSAPVQFRRDLTKQQPPPSVLCGSDAWSIPTGTDQWETIDFLEDGQLGLHDTSRHRVTPLSRDDNAIAVSDGSIITADGDKVDTSVIKIGDPQHLRATDGQAGTFVAQLDGSTTLPLVEHVR